MPIPKTTFDQHLDRFIDLIKERERIGGLSATEFSYFFKHLSSDERQALREAAEERGLAYCASIKTPSGHRSLRWIRIPLSPDPPLPLE